jgi:hypothetical protein
MSRFTIVPLLALFAACGGAAGTTAEDLLTSKAVTGQEETYVEDGMAADDALPLFHECDAQQTFEGLLAEADSDASGALEQDEANSVEKAHRPPPFWPFLHFIYDADDSKDLDEAERQTLLDDHTVRCDAIYAKIVADFDVDGDGALSDEEKAAAAEEIAANPKPQGEPGECEMGGAGGPEGGQGPQGGPEGGQGPQGGEGGPQGGPSGQGPQGEPPEGAGGERLPIPPHLAQAFDLDDNHELDADERAALRADVREHIRSGAPPAPPKGQPPVADAGQDTGE